MTPNTPYWEHHGQRITLPEVQRFISWHNLPIEALTLESILPIATAKTEEQRTENSDRKQPIIVVVRRGKPVLLLDGHHRVEQARRSGDLKITGYVIDFDLVPLEWRAAIAS